MVELVAVAEEDREEEREARPRAAVAEEELWFLEAELSEEAVLSERPPSIDVEEWAAAEVRKRSQTVPHLSW